MCMFMIKPTHDFIPHSRMILRNDRNPKNPNRAHNIRIHITMSTQLPHTENEAKQPSCTSHESETFDVLSGDKAIAYLRYITEQMKYPMCTQLTRGQLKIAHRACPVLYQSPGTNSAFDIISECTCTPNPRTVLPRFFWIGGQSGCGKNMTCNWMRDVMFGKAPESDASYHNNVYLTVDCRLLHADTNQLGQSPRQWFTALPTDAERMAAVSNPDATTSTHKFVRFVAGLSKYKPDSTKATGIVVLTNFNLGQTLVKERLNEILGLQYVVSEHGIPISVKQVIFVLISTIQV
jgi:hypothetical protein